MGTNKRFHATPEFYLKHSLTLLINAEDSGRITAEDKQIILEFIEETAATSQISPTRRYKLINTLILNRAHHPPFRECEISDIYRAIESIKISKNQWGQQITKNTISDKIRMVKRIFVWMAENGYTDIDLRKLQKIKVPAFDRNTISAEDLLSEDEVKRMIESCTNARDRALISTLYEGGFRIGEIGNLLWSDIEFTEWNATAKTSEKTGKERFIPLVASREYLAQWKNDYPLQIKPDSFVFITATTKKPLQYQGLVKQIRKIAARAGITKHIKPHIFRHSRITHLCRAGCNESAIKQMMWGDVSTNMLKVYLHLTKDDVAEQIAKINGIELHSKEESETQGKKFKPIQCPRCARFNPPTAKFCKCGAPLTNEGKGKIDLILDIVRKHMTENPEIMREVFYEMEMQQKEQQGKKEY